MMMMNSEKEVRVYYFSSFHRPRVHFSINVPQSDQSDSEWSQYIMTKSDFGTNIYEVNFTLLEDSIVEFVICGGSDNDNLLWENPRGDREQKLTKGNNFLISNEGTYVIFEGFITQVKQRNINTSGAKKIVLCTDIDGTLYGEHPNQHEEFKYFYLSNGLFLDPRIVLVYSTGRNLEEFKKILHDGKLLYPNILVASCGSEIYSVDSSEQAFEGDPFEINDEWEAYITSDNWNVNSVYDFFASNFPELSLNERHNNNRFKAQFLALTEQTRDLHRFECLMKKASQDLKQSWKYIISGTGTHRFVDILPEKADKGSSLQFVCRRLVGVEVSASVAFGDSLNDTDLLLQAGRSFIVANAQKDLLYWYRDIAEKHPHINVSAYSEATAILRFLESSFVSNRASYK